MQITMILISIPLFFGPIFLIYFIVILFIGIFGIKKSKELWKLKEIDYKEFVFGPIISLAIFGLIYFIKDGKPEDIDLILELPFYLLIIPFISYLLVQFFASKSFFSKILIVNIAFATISLCIIGVFALLKNM